MLQETEEMGGRVSSEVLENEFTNKRHLSVTLKSAPQNREAVAQAIRGMNMHRDIPQLLLTLKPHILIGYIKPFLFFF